MNAAITPFVAVATFEMPMYRPDEAFGMMSVMSAQSTARKLPAADADEDRPDEQRPGSTAPARTIVHARPRRSTQADVDDPLAADPVREPGGRDRRDRRARARRCRSIAKISTARSSGSVRPSARSR